MSRVAALRELREESGITAGKSSHPDLSLNTEMTDEKVKITLLDHWRKDGFISYVEFLSLS
jgi:8-oxo-dGTP pyrophosphatase MutT (NUDIX family)